MTKTFREFLNEGRFNFVLNNGKKHVIKDDIEVWLTGGELNGVSVKDKVKLEKGLKIQSEKVPNSDRARFKVFDGSKEIGFIIMTSDAEYGNALEKEAIKGNI